MTSVLLGLVSGLSVTGLYALGAIVFAVIGVMSTLVRTCAVNCHPGVIIFGFFIEIAVALMGSIVLVGLPIIPMTLATGFLIGIIEKVTSGQLSRKAALIFSLGIAVLIGTAFEIILALRVATPILGEHIIGTPWGTVTRLWQGLPIVMYGVISLCLGWVIHDIFQHGA